MSDKVMWGAQAECPSFLLKLRDKKAQNRNHILGAINMM